MDSSELKATKRLDCSWQLCPVPILMTEEKIAEMADGEVLEVVFTDPGAKPDLEAWCRVHGHPLLGFRIGKDRSSAYVKKKGP